MSRRLPLLDRRYATPEAAAKDYAEAAKVPLQIGATAMAERLCERGIIVAAAGIWRLTQKPPERPKRIS